MKHKSISILLAISISLYSVVAAVEVGPDVLNSNNNQQTIVTSNGDSLCVLSNGNNVPCEIVKDAEKSIEFGGKTINPNTGKVLCSYNNRVVDCDKIKANGSLKLTSYREIAFEGILFIYMYKWIFTGVILVLALVILKIIINKVKLQKANKILGLLLIVAVSAIGLSLRDKVSADVPVYSGINCSCTTSASQTCVTSPSVDFNWLTIGPGTSASSCTASDTYSTYLWPNTPPQFFYQGIETVVGDVTAGNKNEAKGLVASLVPSASVIGQDTGIPCLRNGGAQGMTLKFTGKLNYTVQGICLIGTCQYYGKESKNFSCY